MAIVYAHLNVDLNVPALVGCDFDNGRVSVGPAFLLDRDNSAFDEVFI